MALAALGLAELFALFALSLGLGLRLLRLLRVKLADGAERALCASGLGLGALQFIPFAAFALRIGTPNVLRGALAILALLLLRDMAEGLRSVQEILRKLAQCAGWKRVFLAALLVLLLALLIHALGPVADGDALDYHLTLPLRLLRAGRWIYVPTITPTNWPSALEMLYCLPLAIHLDSPIGIIPFLCGVLTLATMACYGKRLANSFVSALAIGLLLLYDGGSSVGFWQQMGTGMVDVGTTLFATLAIFLTHCALFRDERDATTPPDSGLLCLSALFAGLAATTKLTGVWIIVSLCLAQRLAWKRPADILRYFSIAILTALPWFVKTWLVTGNPVYPMFYNALGGIEWTAAGWPRYQRAHMIRNTPPNMLPSPNVLLTTHLLIGSVCLLVCLFALWRTRRSALRIPVGAAAVFTACIGFANYFLPRFFMPIIPTALLCVAYTLRNRERQMAKPVTALFVLLTLLFLRRDQKALAATMDVLRGAVSRESYLRAAISDYDVAQYINSHFSAETTILIGDYDHEIASYHARALWPDCWLQDSIHYAPPARLETDMRRLNVTLLVLKTDFPDWCGQSHYCRERMQTETPALTQLAQRRGKPLFASNGFTLYALDWTPKG